MLLIDNDKEFAKELHMLIKTLNGFDIICFALNQGNFVERINNESPDIIFIHIGAKDIDGFNIGREIKKLKTDVKIIYFSDSDRFATTAFEEGASDYIVCPVTKERLEITMRRVC